MKHFISTTLTLVLALLLNACGGSSSSTTPPVVPPANTNGQWAWISGTSYTTLGTGLGSPGVYGTLGVAAAANVPGSRGVSAGWADSDGSFYTFGGFGLDSTGTAPGDLNDVWNFNPTTSQWTWIAGSSIANAVGIYGMQGVAATTNTPSAREVAGSWKDASGNFWIFGGGAYDESGHHGVLNDLWMFSPSAKSWTWVTGSKTSLAPSIYGTLGVAAAQNSPGSRQGSATWVDSSGTLWLFGGYANGLDDWDDLWKFDVTTKQWTWVGGSSTRASIGVYGTLGTTAVAVHPGAREDAATFTDASGNLWLFGGYGYDSAGKRSRLNDVWMLSPSTLAWTWEAGSNIAEAVVSYGTKGTTAASNTPGARAAEAYWKDTSGNFWLLGGTAYVNSGTVGELGDLWMFNVGSKQWTWVGGSNEVNALGVYGTEGTPAAGNAPGSMDAALGITDVHGNLWLLGGDAPDRKGSDGVALNDLWRYHP